MTAEANVKKHLRKFLDRHPDRIARFTPATGGFGAGGVSDEAGTVSVRIEAAEDGGAFASTVSDRASEDFIGAAFYIECKATGGKLSAAQKLWLSRNAKLGAFCCVLWPEKAHVYGLDGECAVLFDADGDYIALCEAVVAHMLSGEWL